VIENNEVDAATAAAGKRGSRATLSAALGAGANGTELWCAARALRRWIARARRRVVRAPRARRGSRSRVRDGGSALDAAWSFLHEQNTESDRWRQTRRHRLLLQTDERARP